MTGIRKSVAVAGPAAALLTAVLVLAGAPLARAADGAAPVPLGAADLARAHDAARDPAVLDRLGHFFAHGGALPAQWQTLDAAQEARAAAAAAPRLVGDPVAVYTLDEGFVAGTPGAPVARTDFVASRAVSADGRVASVWTVRRADGWKVVDIASGGDESDYAAKAADTGGGTAFREPQLNAWYVLRDGRVLPLDDEARRSVGADGATVAAYQSLVHRRYGDKLPGSAYDRAGLGGGYRPDEAGPATSGGGATLPAVTVAALGLTALAGAGVALRRRVRG
ncbi:hypothetical protein [Kitasatospora sp. NBC_00315]|uniref:hypothetical protein n=1 Tax=Kitasatospora sp. NBC_00315 TaxID=2975963 RepID=UPI0032536792